MRIRISVFSFVVAPILTGCGSNSVTGPGGPVLDRITITGPSSVVPGASAKFVATGHLSDGTQNDYSANATWNSQNTAVLLAGSAGTVTGRTQGETVLSANVGSISGSMSVLVLPAGTYRLSGVVTSSLGVVSGATVSIVAGVGTGLKAVTDASGTYRLYGVAGVVQLEVTRSGFARSVQAVSVTGNIAADVTLEANTSSIDLSSLPGTYSMDVTATQPCSYAMGTLPDDLKSRHYTATLVVNGTTVAVTLSGANFLISAGHGASFTMQYQPDGLTFRLGDGYYYSVYPDLVESLSPSSALLIYGTGSLEPNGTTLSGFYNGQYAISGLPVGAQWITTCYSPAHKIVLTRISQPASRVRR